MPGRRDLLIALLAVVAAVVVAGGPSLGLASGTGSLLPADASALSVPGGAGASHAGAGGMTSSIPWTGTGPHRPLDLASAGHSVSGPSRGGADASPSLLFPPNPHRQFSALPTGVVTPYPSAPAPMGLADLGVGSSGAYVYNTTGFEGALKFTSFRAFTPGFTSAPNFSTPDWGLLQLNAVAVNVSFPGASNGTFWAQNGVRLNGTELQFEDNIWNFSRPGAYLPPSTLHSLSGHFYREEAYYALGPSCTMSFPLTVHLFNNISTVGGQTVLQFGYTLTGGGTGCPAHATYDTVTFNGTTSPSSPSQFLVDGRQYNPAGLLDDAELVLGGNGAGSNANLFTLAGTLTLAHWNAGTSHYEAIRSAYDFGADSSETALGVAAYYLGTTEYLGPGPSFLRGFWNTTSDPIASAVAPGFVHIQLTLTPAYALVFATNSTDAARSLAAAGYSYAPSTASGIVTTNLPPAPVGDPYVFHAWADGCADGGTSVTNNTTGVQNLALSASATTWNAPLYLRGTLQTLAFAGAGVQHTTYSSIQSTLWVNATTVALAAPFLRINDFGYPTFQLVAVRSSNVSISLNAFHQDPSTFNYTDEKGVPHDFPGWTQGYFFYFGTGHFSVSTTTITGNPSLVYAYIPLGAPATIDLYRTGGGSVNNVTVSGQATGVEILDTPSVSVTRLTASDGSTGLLAHGASNLVVKLLKASGRTVARVPSTAAQVVASPSVTFTGVNVSGGALGLLLDGISSLTLAWLNVSSNATGIRANNTGPASVTQVNITGGPPTAAGAWTNSTQLVISSVKVVGLGLHLAEDTQVTVRNGIAVGEGSAVIAAFAFSASGSFSNLEADQGAAAVNASNSTALTFHNLTASNGSVGAYVSNSTNLNGNGLTSTGKSAGIIWQAGSQGTFLSLTTSNQSIAAYIANVSTVSVQVVSASNATLGASTFFNNSTDLAAYPIAAVGLYGDSVVHVSDVTAWSYPFAVWSNRSASVDVSSVTDYYGFRAVVFNDTNSSEISQLFAYGVRIAVEMQNCSSSKLDTSTLEGSLSAGLDLANGTGVTITRNNFVANNGSYVNGTFNKHLVQAWANNTSPATATFSSNYWADHSGLKPYVVNSSNATAVKDLSPASSFIASYVEFVERGLPTGTVWAFELGTIPYTSVSSLVYVPGWALATGTLPFSVAPAGGLPPHPIAGSITWNGVSSQTQTIVFGNPKPSGLDLPWWAYAAIGAGAAGGLAAFVLVRRRRRPRGGVRGPTPPPTKPTPPPEDPFA